MCVCTVKVHYCAGVGEHNEDVHYQQPAVCQEIQLEKFLLVRKLAMKEARE
jgi:hypothetical protein